MVARRGLAAAAAALVVLTFAGCGAASDDKDTSAGDATSTPGSPTETWDLVVLSDSSAWGLGEAWAELIRRDEGVEVRVQDFAVGGQSGSALLEHLTTPGDPQREAVREAEVISVWGSPGGLVWDSDLGNCMNPDGTRPPTRISRKDLEPYARLWRDILSEISSLREGQSTAVRARDIYNPLVPRYVAAGTAEACAEGSRMMSSIIREETRRAGGQFIPVYRAFNGPDGLEDPRDRPLFMDLEHLSDKGAALMAGLHHKAGYPELTQE
jgi:hypothetical protein